MKNSKFVEILKQYEFGNSKGNVHALFKKYSDWFKQSNNNGILKLALADTLKEVIQTNDLRKYDFVLLVIQVFNIDFTKEDKHFELLFSIANSIIKDFKISESRDKRAYLLHQLTDICIHRHDEVNFLAKRKPELLKNLVEKIGKVKYSLTESGLDISLAAYKAVGLIWYLSKEDAKILFEEIYLRHPDETVVDEAEKLIIQLKEEGGYFNLRL